MVCPDDERLGCAFQPVTPLLQGQLHSKKLPVTDIVVSLGGGQAPGEEGTGVKLAVGWQALGQNGSHPSV